MTKKLRFAFLILLLIPLGLTSVYADPVDPNAPIRFGDISGRPGVGGPFALLQENSAHEWVQVALTMCVEFNEYLRFNTTYLIESISDRATGGGVGGYDGTNSDGISYDILGEDTAWIFYHFATGALFGDPLGAAAVAQYAAVQGAIWCLEGESGTGCEGNSLYSALIADAQAAVTGGWSNGGRVAVLNPVSLDGNTLMQSQLILTTPEPSTLLLLGTGLLGFALGGRFLRRKH